MLADTTAHWTACQKVDHWAAKMADQSAGQKVAKTVQHLEETSVDKKVASWAEMMDRPMVHPTVEK
jgi:aspartokinase-like uncharacterized kinase